jgi:hypothetical protein
LPPLIEASLPLAVFCNPPLAAEYGPEATFRWPAETVASVPDARLPIPPVTEANPCG